MEILLLDLRYALRILRKAPGLTAAIIITLALGIGANTAIFSLVYSVLLKALPYPEADRLAMLWSYDPKGETAGASGADFGYFQQQNHAFENLCAWYSRSMSWQRPSGGRSIFAIQATPNYFDTVGIKPALGRVFLPAEGGLSTPAAGVAILSGKMWQQEFAADPQIVGKLIVLDHASYTVIGVMPQGFRIIAPEPDLWTPLTVDTTERTYRYLYVFGRLRPGKSVSDASAELSVLTRQLEKTFPKSNKGWTARPDLLSDWLVQGTVRRTLWTLLVAIGFVLLMACMNIANLLLSRSVARSREIAMRVALGASSARLARQLLTEALLYSLTGGVAGLLLARWLIRIGPALIPPSLLPSGTKIELSVPVMLFTLAAAIATGLLFGLAPLAARGSMDLQSSLKESSRAATTGLGGARFRAALLIAEVALAFVVLVGTSLMAQTVVRLQSTDFGFEPRHLLTVWMPLPKARYSSSPRLLDFFHSVLDRVLPLPGVTAADFTSNIPLQPYIMRISFDHEEAPLADPNDRPTVNYQMIGSGYLGALGIPLLQGRNFESTDGPESPKVALINNAFAQAYFAGSNPLGKRVVLSPPVLGKDTFGARTVIEIVGVVGDTHVASLSSGAHYNFAPGKPVPECYVPSSQNQWSGMVMLVLRTSGDPASLAPAVRTAIAAIDKDQNLALIAPMEQVLYTRATTPRFRARLMAIFSGLAILLAAVGVYSLTSFAVTQRSREFGIRMALGARGGAIMRSSLQPILLLVIAGIVAGLAGAAATSRLLRSFLYGVSPSDPFTVGMAAIAFVLIALLAGALPARRATRIDPIQTLRDEH
jgi:putative ABC transport system permease protein